MYLSVLFVCFAINVLHDGFVLTNRTMNLTSVGRIATPDTNTKHLYISASETGSRSVNLVAKNLSVSIIFEYFNYMCIGYNRRRLITECECYCTILRV
jgi:hypothetical protein